MRISDWSSDVCSSDLPDFLRLGALLGLMLERHPAVHTDLSYGVSGSVLAQIASAQLDVGFYLGLPTDKRLYATTLTSFHYCVAAPRGAEILRDGSLRLDMAGPVVACGRGLSHWGGGAPPLRGGEGVGVRAEERG